MAMTLRLARFAAVLVLLAPAAAGADPRPGAPDAGDPAGGTTAEKPPPLPTPQPAPARRPEPGKSHANPPAADSKSEGGVGRPAERNPADGKPTPPQPAEVNPEGTPAEGKPAESKPEGIPTESPPPEVKPETTEPPPASLKPIAPEEASGILGKKVYGPAGEDMGMIIDVLVDGDGRPRAAVIDFGGFLGVGSRKIAIDWPLLQFRPADRAKPVALSLGRAEVQAAPEYKPSTQPAEMVAQPPSTSPPASPDAEK